MAYIKVFYDGLETNECDDEDIEDILYSDGY